MTALPEFVTGTLLILVFALNLGVLPAVSVVPPGQSPLQNPEILILPWSPCLPHRLLRRSGWCAPGWSRRWLRLRRDGTPERL